jgi:hypothetical protein
VKQQQYRPGAGNPFIRYAWLSVYYREAATAAEFHAKDPGERWQLLRNRVLVAPPKDDGLRQRAVDAIPQDIRLPLLQWLQSRDRGGGQGS